MDDYNLFYINGSWEKPVSSIEKMEVINPAIELPIATISLGNGDDINSAVAAAKKAFEVYARTSVKDRIEILQNILTYYELYSEEMADNISKEMGAPLHFSRSTQVPRGVSHIKQAISSLKEYSWQKTIDNTLIKHEPIGVVGMITPWNWPINQITCKVAPALAAGCTMVLKPSEIAPLSALLFAKIIDKAGVPSGIFNMVNGEGSVVGEAMAAHPDIDMISITGSTRAGICVAKTAADTVKRVSQELGGKSPNIILDDDQFSSAIKHGVAYCFANSGQSCLAPSRMLVPAHRYAEAIDCAHQAACEVKVGDPKKDDSTIGPVVSEAQFQKIQNLIQQGLDEGGQLVVGGVGRPEGLAIGYYVKPTILSHVTNDMTVAREEIFGPVLCLMAYDNVEQAITIANDTPYGLFAYVSGPHDQAMLIADQLRAGGVSINGAVRDFSAPFGGYKQSGNGREWGVFGMEEFMEVKAISGC